MHIETNKLGSWFKSINFVPKHSIFFNACSTTYNAIRKHYIPWRSKHSHSQVISRYNIYNSRSKVITVLKFEFSLLENRRVKQRLRLAQDSQKSELRLAS